MSAGTRQTTVVGAEGFQHGGDAERPSRAEIGAGEWICGTAEEIHNRSTELAHTEIPEAICFGGSHVNYANRDVSNFARALFFNFDRLFVFLEYDGVELPTAQDLLREPQRSRSSRNSPRHGR